MYLNFFQNNKEHIRGNLTKTTKDEKIEPLNSQSVHEFLLKLLIYSTISTRSNIQMPPHLTLPPNHHKNCKSPHFLCITTRNRTPQNSSPLSVQTLSKRIDVSEWNYQNIRTICCCKLTDAERWVWRARFFCWVCGNQRPILLQHFKGSNNKLLYMANLACALKKTATGVCWREGFKICE